MNIAVDAMGGDHAPKLVVRGAIRASESGINVTLVGDAKTISSELSGKLETEHIRIHHCGEVVLMDESPLKGVRKKKDSSIRVAFDLLKKGKVDAVVSAGNSGATMAAGILTLGKLDGVERPAIACIVPGDNGRVILIDVGGNVDCRPVHLLQFGIMANAFATSCLGLNEPKVGLLSIGQEAGKGNEQVRLAYDLLQESSLKFTGNIEGQDIFSGSVQIVVCDGFVGNIALKLSEGMAEAVTSRLKEYMMSSLTGKALALFGRGFFKRFEETLDYAEYGGAPILGIKGVGIVCHGSSSAKAIKNAIKMAVNYVENRVQERISFQIAEFQS
ncbi:phosphate acyltransferase PlsX [Thermodesulfobacteriota bacterium]